MDWQALRSQFPATRGQTYLDTAAYGPPPEKVAAVVEDAVRGWATGTWSSSIARESCEVC